MARQHHDEDDWPPVSDHEFAVMVVAIILLAVGLLVARAVA